MSLPEQALGGRAAGFVAAMSSGACACLPLSLERSPRAWRVVPFGMATRSLRATSGVLLSAAGMATLCVGLKVPALSLFALGIFQVERDWRRRHAEFRGGIGARWSHALDFYSATHQEPTNRFLHVVGIPLIVGGAIGLVTAPPVLGPVRLASLTAFGVGWLMNLVGHALFEKRAPAFSEDALSFLAGPAWDLRQLLDAAVRRAR